MYTNCICSETRREFIMRFENIGDTAWELVEARERPLADYFTSAPTFKMFESQKLSGEFPISPHYSGCPFCGMKSFFVCGSCGLPNCHDGSTEVNGEPVSVTCAKCGNTAELIPLEELKLAEDYSTNAE